MNVCQTCDGTGYTIEYHAGVPAFEKLRCLECNGTGRVRDLPPLTPFPEHPPRRHNDWSTP